MASKQDVTSTEQLRRDNRRIEHLLTQFDKAGEPDERESVFNTLSSELSVHMRLEESVLCPAVKGVIEDAKLTQYLEHITKIRLIVDRMQRLSASEEGDPFSATMAELKAALASHIEFAEQNLFPEIEKSDLDLVAIGKRMEELKKDPTASNQVASGAKREATHRAERA